MMFRPGLVICSLFLSGQALAEQIIVRAGAHPGFTRLVMELPDGSDWRIEADGQTHRLVISPYDEGFDTSEVFDLIDRRHLDDIEGRGDTARMELNCACDVTGFTLPNGYLVVDIAEREAPLPPGDEVPRFEYGELLWQRPRPQAPADSPADDVDIVIERHLNETRNQLLLSLSDAASRGLLQGESDLADPQPPVAGALDAMPENPNLRVTDSSAPTTSATSGAAGTVAPLCPSPSVLAVGSWGSGGSFSTQIGVLRRELFQEFDRLSEDQALALARLYLHFGFGAEARQVLGMQSQGGAAIDAMLDLADLMEYGEVEDPRVLANWRDCGEQTSLWALLAMGDAGEISAANREAALRNLAELPAHLRRIFAPRLSEVFLQGADTQAAGLAMRNLERMPQNPLPNAALIGARIEQQNGNNDAATALSEMAIDSNSVESPRALIELVHNRIDSGDSISAETALLVEAYYFELQGHALFADLRRAHILASAHSGQFDKAFEALEGASDTLIADVFVQLGHAANDMDFLRYYYTNKRPLLANLSQPAAVHVSARLEALGFLQEARTVLEGLDPSAWGQAERLRLAKALAEVGQNDQALGLLKDVPGAKASGLRGEILHRQGQSGVAVGMLQQAGQQRQADETAWLAANWQDLLTAETPVFGPALQAAQETMDPILPQDGMLSRSRAAADQSAQVRSALRRMLQDLEISDPN
jgi:hypothetical protein